MNAAVFHQAVCDGDATRVKFLINLGQQARVNQVNKQGLTALQQSCKDGKLDVVHVLLNHGANTGLTGRIKETALHLAASGGHKAIVELLISSCAQLDSKNEDGQLPVDVAKTEEIKELLKKAELDKKAKSAEANKRKNSGVDEWGQSLNNLPPGSRNSLVSNSSSDSGVFTDPDSTSTHVTQTQHRRNTRSRSFSSYENQRPLAMGVLNEWEEGTHEKGFLAAQTTGDAKQTKLRRSNSERLPSHQRRRTLRKLSEELSALNLSRSVVQEYQEEDENSEHASNVHHNRLELRDHENKDYLKPHYISRGLGSVNVERRKNDINDNYIIRATQVKPIVSINEEKDEGWEDGEDLPDSPPPVLLSRVRDDKTGQLRPIACDELDLYRRSQRSARGSARRQTVDVCESSHAQTSQRNAQSWLNAQQQQKQKHYTDNFLYPDANQMDGACLGTCPNLARSMSTCSDSEIRKYYRRLQKTSEMNNMAHRPRRYTYDCVPEKRDYHDHYYQTNDSNNNNTSHLPGYEETVRRLNNDRAARRPNSRQISQV